MILLFPNYDTLRLCLTSNTVTPDVTLKDAKVSFDAHGGIFLEPSVDLSAPTRKLLDRLGVKGSKRHGSANIEHVTSWLQVIPVTKEAGAPNISTQAPVLFEVDTAGDLPQLVTEMLRLGNDRQSFRWIAAPNSPEGKRVLLRVIGPPYYTLLRALDRLPATGGVRAYLERAPRVWVEIGYTHPYATQIRIANDQLLLIREPREWLFLEDAPFQDVYEILKFELPATPVEWVAAETPKPLVVPLRLTAGNAVDVPELWVMRQDAVNQLDRFVRDADERLTQRLMFAVATDQKGERTVVLRTRPSKLAPPLLPLERALGFKPFWKLPNLYLPAGRRLHPTLRRDAVRKLIADDPDQVVWLYPDGQNGFTPESVPDTAFRPLEDWVDYVIEVERSPLAAWIDATRFDFDQFICKDTGPRPKPPDKGDREPRAAPDEEPTAVKAAGPPRGSRSKSGSRSANKVEFAQVEEVRDIGEWKQKLDDLEKQFLSIEGGLDAAERKSLWPELARANTGVGSQAEAAVCWLNALWDQESPPSEWLGAWMRSELNQPNEGLTAAEFDRYLNAKSPSPMDVRVVVVGFLWLANQQPVPAWLTSRLAAVQRFLETNETALPVRATWLAAVRLFQISGSDLLGVARVRDRLLLHLLEQGVSPERDMPNFLRYAGLKDSERLREVREKVQDVYRAAQDWIERAASTRKHEGLRRTQPYLDLMFAFCLARLGEHSLATQLLEKARGVMESARPSGAEAESQAQVIPYVRDFLFRGFQHRVKQAIAGKPHFGSLPDELIAERDTINKRIALLESAGERKHINQLILYAIERTQEEFRVFDPQERMDRYGAITRGTDISRKAVYDLCEVRDAKFPDRIRRALREGTKNAPLLDFQYRLLKKAIPLAPRWGEAFTMELIGFVPSIVNHPITDVNGKEQIEAAEEQGRLLDSAIHMAGHFGRSDAVRSLLRLVPSLMARKPASKKNILINKVARSCITTMRKLGLRDETNDFFHNLHEEVIGGTNLAALREQYLKKPEEWYQLLQTHLTIAAGWLTLGFHDRAAPTLDYVRHELLDPQASQTYSSHPYTQIVRSYVFAIGHGGCASGIVRIIDLFTKMPPQRIDNAWTGSMHYSLYHLNVIEDVILALVSDEFALGPAGRRWLDDDEYLVRQRIHADMKRERERHGL